MPRPLARPPSRFLALVFPHLGVDRVRCQRGHLFVGREPGPIATAGRCGRACHIASVDREAAALGLKPGQALAEAKALVPTLEVFAADPAAELDWLAALADGCRRDAAAVAMAPPDALLLDITEATRPEREIAAAIEARLARRGLRVRHAVGQTPDAACALARFAGGAAPDAHQALRRLPVAALDLDEDMAEAMAEAGCRTVADLVALSPAGLATRFGAETAAALRRLFDAGTCAPLPRRDPVLRVEHQPDAGVPVAASLAAVAALAAEALRGRGTGAARLELWLFAEDGTARRRPIAPPQPVEAAAAIERLLRHAAEEGDCDLIRLDVTAIAPPAAGLFPLGTVPVPQGARPRRSAAAGAGSAAQAELLLLPAAARDRSGPLGTEAPIHLFDPPQPIRPTTDALDGPPAAFRWRRTLHRIARASGPERVGGGPRDYYRVEDGRGRRLWIFRGADEDHARWYVHGVFA